MATFIRLGRISGCKQHLIHPTTPGFWGPSGISVGIIALCSLCSPFHASSASLVLTSTNFRTIHSFSVPPFLLILVPLSNRQRRVSNLSRLGWIPTNSKLTMTKLRHWLSVLARKQLFPAISTWRLVVF